MFASPTADNSTKSVKIAIARRLVIVQTRENAITRRLAIAKSDFDAARSQSLI